MEKGQIMKKSSSWLFLSFNVLLLSACVSIPTITPTVGPSGNKAYTINCSGEGGALAEGWNACMRAISELCGTKGYNIIMSKSQSYSESYQFDYGRTKIERVMVVECKEEAGGEIIQEKTEK